MEIHDTTAQDIIDALRFCRMAQKDPAETVKLLDALLELAPATEDSRGIRLLTDLICEGSLKVALVDA
jgi:hypothetical protein